MKLSLAVLLASLGCARSASTPPPSEPPSAAAATSARPAPTKSGDAPCPNIDGALAAWLEGGDGADRVSVDDEGRASVVVRLDDGAEPPAALDLTRLDDDRAYGHLHRDDLCATASSPGVLAIRAAARPSPK